MQWPSYGLFWQWKLEYRFTFECHLFRTWRNVAGHTIGSNLHKPTRSWVDRIIFHHSGTFSDLRQWTRKSGLFRTIQSSSKAHWRLTGFVFLSSSECVIYMCISSFIWKISNGSGTHDGGNFNFRPIFPLFRANHIGVLITFRPGNSSVMVCETHKMQGYTNFSMING